MGRLVKGQTAPGVLAISRIALDSVQRRVEVFQFIRAGQKEYFDKLRYFKSAQLLAEWDDPYFSISRVSVKTLRKYIVKFYPDGLASMCKAARNMEGSSVQAKRLSLGSNYKLQSERAIDSALEMTVRYLDVIERFKKLSSKDKSFRKELEQHFRKFGQNPHIQQVP